MSTKRFNLRVYGILINDNQEVLVSDEIQLNTRMTKFPGGGLEFGEGTKECLIREWKEELSVDISVSKLLYVNDFLQVSSFDPKDQIVAFYYLVQAPLPLPVPIKTKRYDFAEIKNGIQSFRWIPVPELTDDALTFPIDKKLASMLRNGLLNNL